MASDQIETLKEQFAKFKADLELFARKHQKEIAKNPMLRCHFQKMCTNIGVDPLASSKGFWAEVLGVGDFYYELGVKIVEACFKLREQTGGLVDLQTIKQRIGAGQKAAEVEDDDIIKAIDTLKPLGSGFKVIRAGKHLLVQSVPRELSTDTTALIDLASASGHLDVPYVMERLRWTEERTGNAINALLSEGLVWIDEQSDPISYWVPGLFPNI